MVQRVFCSPFSFDLSAVIRRFTSVMQAVSVGIRRACAGVLRYVIEIAVHEK